MKGPAGRIDLFVREPERGIRAVLVYGPDSGLVRERADALVKALAGSLDDPFRVGGMTGAELQKDPARLADAMGALALTGGRRAVRSEGPRVGAEGVSKFSSRWSPST